ncbi:2'-5' RNA ligase family protein [Lacipirellula sp.]|uniref:2'-5' RNA ligase family protein n=1 Tax=Lacipirellula sp. TaxID=2691419 RepID=UPI003D09B414
MNPLQRFLATFAVVSLVLAANAAAPAAELQPLPDVVAIDVLLHPDKTMLAAATKANEQLRTDYPAGFSLDKLHTPHISTIQRFVRRDDLARIEAELDRVFAVAKPTALELEATGYYSLPVGDLGLAGIVIKPTSELRDLQDRIIAAVEPFAVEGTADAFVPSADGAAIAPSIVDYVNGYVPERSGKNFNPHVTVGLGNTPFVKRLIAAPFPAFKFRITGASVYHLGNYGTAAVELWSPDDKPVAK